MVKSKLGRFLDNSWIFFSIFVISFVLFKTRIANNYIILPLSLINTFLLFNVLLFFQNKKYKQLSLKTSENQEIMAYNFELRKLSPSSQETFFKNLLSSKQIIKSPHGLIVENEILIFNGINHDTIYPETIFSIYSKAKNMKKYNIKEICIICNKISEETKNLIKNFTDIKIIIFSPIETYALMKKYSHFPSLSNQKIKTKPNIFKEAFMKQKGKSFIKCGIILYIFSLFLPFTKYYLITASFLTILGTICMCFGKSNKIDESISKQKLLN